MQLAIEQLQQELKQVHARLGGLFKRSEPRQRCLDYLQGLLSGVPRKNGWQLAQWMGEATPDGVQHLLERAHWSADAARDVLREYVVKQLGVSARRSHIDLCRPPGYRSSARSLPAMR